MKASEIATAIKPYVLRWIESAASQQVSGGWASHDPVSLGSGSDPALRLVGQVMTLDNVLTLDEHLAIGDDAPHHAPVTAGPDIVVTDQQVGRSGNKVLLFHASGAAVSEYAFTVAGIQSAHDAASASDKIEVPSGSIVGTLSLTKSLTISGAGIYNTTIFGTGESVTIDIQGAGVSVTLENMRVSQRYATDVTKNIWVHDDASLQINNVEALGQENYSNGVDVSDGGHLGTNNAYCDGYNGARFASDAGDSMLTELTLWTLKDVADAGALNVAGGNITLHSVHLIAPGASARHILQDGAGTVGMYLVQATSSTFVPCALKLSGAGISYNSGDRSSFIVTGTTHASDIAAAALTRHLPLPGTANNTVYDDGTNWVSGKLPIAALAAGTVEGQFIRAGADPFTASWSTLTLPNAATQGDLMVATGANGIGSLADVAAGSVLVSGGVGAVPAYSASPTLTGLTLSGLTASTVIYSNASKAIASLANAAGYLKNNGAGTLSWDVGVGWLLTGNAGTNPGTSFLGTTDAKAVIFKRNSTEVMQLSEGGLALDQQQAVYELSDASTAPQAQSFTCRRSGQCPYVDVELFSTTPTASDFTLRQGENVAGAVLATGSTATDLTGVGFARWWRITFAASADLVAGQEYTIVWNKATGADFDRWSMNSTNPYSGGRSYRNGAWQDTEDRDFKTYINSGVVRIVSTTVPQLEMAESAASYLTASIASGAVTFDAVGASAGFTFSVGAASCVVNGTGGLTINGGIAANDDITIQGTSHATRTTSYMLLQPNGGNVGVGMSAPSEKFTLLSTGYVGWTWSAVDNTVFHKIGHTASTLPLDYINNSGDNDTDVLHSFKTNAGGVPNTLVFSIARGGDTLPGGHKTQDFGAALTAWDDGYADDWNNVADFYCLDDRDDLGVICGIRPLGTYDVRTGLPLVDDTTLPEWMLVRHKSTGKIVRDPDGKPFVSNRTMTSLLMGAIRAQQREIEELRAMLFASMA